MKFSLYEIGTLFFICILLSSCSTKKVFYVSSTGSDQNKGTKSHPFASLERAKSEIGKNAGRPITIFLREGYYSLQESFILEEMNSQNGAPLLVSAYAGEEVHIIGGQEISGFKPLNKQSEASQRIEVGFRDNILQLDLKALGIHDYGEILARGFGRDIQASGLELYFNEKPMTLSRWPNKDWANVEEVPESLGGKGFTYSGNRPANWTHTNDIWLHGYWKWDWSDSYVKVASIDTLGKVIMTDFPYSNYPYTKGKRFYAFNLLEELDEPGEWYLDRETGILYFWPPSDPEKAKMHISLLRKPIIQLSEAINVTLKNLILEYTCGAGVEIIGGSGNVVEDCILRNIGTVAVSIGKLKANIGTELYDNPLYNGNAGTGNGIEGCEIYSTGEGGILLGGGDRKTLSPGKNFAINNNIYGCSRWVRTYRAGIFMYGVGNLVAHNLIHDLPHTAVFFWGNDHLLEYNEIHHVCMETGDAGAFYIGRDWTQRGSTIRYNYFHHLRGVLGHSGFIDVMGIYLDDWASGVNIFGNVFYKAGRSIMIGGGRDNIVDNNIIIDGNPALHIDARGLGWAKYYFDGSNNTLFERLKLVNPLEPPFGTRYPELTTILEEDPVLPKGNKVMRNIQSGGRWIDLRNGVNDSIVYFQDNMINADSSFYKTDHNKIQFLEGEGLYPAGFQHIPIDLIGLIKEDRSER